MARHLFIVESPGKTRKIEQYLGAEWTVKASFGHVRDLPEKEIGVEPPDFKPHYRVLAKQAGRVAQLKQAAQQADIIYLGTDPDREGEAIAWHLYMALGLKNLGKPVYRVRFQEINAATIRRAVEEAGPIHHALVSAQEARRVMDRLAGYLVSPQLGFGLSAGRVQSPALRLIVEREEGIRAFQPLNHFQVVAQVEQPSPWSATWDFSPFAEKDQAYWLDRGVAEVVAQVTQLTIKSVEPSQFQRRPLPPFTTSTLQQAASAYLGLAPERTMQLAQALYESGAITYHRTDSPHLSDEAVRAIREYLTQAGQPLSRNPNQWAAKADAQEAHEAIRPVDLKQKHPSADATTNKLYALIWRRTVASQMPNAVYDVLKLRCVGNVAVPLGEQPLAEFQATGRVLVDKGWLAITQEHENEDRDPEHLPLPPLQVGEVYPCRGEVHDKKTQPPKRYTEAGLIKKLESLGIGRPSTYASILATLKKREYVRVERRLLHPMPVGEQVIQRLRDSGFSFLRDDYTRAMESRLDDIARGQSKYLTVVRDGHGVLMDELSHLPAAPRQAPPARSTANAQSASLSGQEACGTCRCGGEIVERPKSWTCTACQATVWKTSFDKKFTLKQAQGLLSGNVIALKGLKSKAGKKYDAKAAMEEGKVKLIFLNIP